METLFCYTVLSSLRRVIINALKLFAFSRSDSTSSIVMQLSLSLFDTVIHKSRVLFDSHCSLSGNTVTMHLRSFS